MVRADSTYEVDPVSRIEGHLGVRVDTVGGFITNAKAHGNLWRGFENFLLGRDANDAITFVQRICGVCPVPHGLTSTYAVDSVLGYSEGHITFADNGTFGVPNKAVSIRNLVAACDSVMSSITHFYHLAAPSYIQGPNMAPWTPYFADSFYTQIDPVLASMRSQGKQVPTANTTDGFSSGLWDTVIRSYVVALRMRRLAFEAGALFAGRMPMTSTYVAGGVTFDGTESLGTRCDTFETLMQEVALFVIQEYVPIALALGLLYTEYDNTNNTSLVATAAGLISVALPSPKGYGSGLRRYLAWGAYPQADGAGADGDTLTSAGGYIDINTVHGAAPDFKVLTKKQVHDQFLDGGTNSVKLNLTEDIANSRYAVDTVHDGAAYGAGTSAYPGDVSRTKPMRKNGYTYMKAPRWAGLSCEVGPMARLFVHGLFVDNQALANPAGAIYPFYSKYVKGTGLNPAMVNADIAVVLLRAGLATIQNATVAGALSLAANHDFTYAEVVAHITDIRGLVGGVTNKETIAAAYGNADTIITGPITAWVLNLRAGASTMDRLRARALETLYLIQQVVGVYTPSTTGLGGAFSTSSWIRTLKAQSVANSSSTSTWKAASSSPVAHGWGAHEAARGALMHHITQVDGKITKYQCIVPTTWNGSPVIGSDTVKLNHGAIEAAIIGAPFADAPSPTLAAAGGVEVLRVAQSFDPCIACAIH